MEVSVQAQHPMYSNKSGNINNNINKKKLTYRDENILVTTHTMKLRRQSWFNGRETNVPKTITLYKKAKITI